VSATDAGERINADAKERRAMATAAGAALSLVENEPTPAAVALKDFWLAGEA